MAPDADAFSVTALFSLIYTLPAPVVLADKLPAAVRILAPAVPIEPLPDKSVTVDPDMTPAVSVILPEPLAVRAADVVPVALAPSVILPLLAVVVNARIPDEITPEVVMLLLSLTLS